jgi:hypothetical protein
MRPVKCVAKQREIRNLLHMYLCFTAGERMIVRRTAGAEKKWRYNINENAIREPGQERKAQRNFRLAKPGPLLLITSGRRGSNCVRGWMNNCLGRVDGGHQRLSHADEHHPIPILVNLHLFLLGCHLLQMCKFLQPCYPPAEIPMLINFVCCKGNRGRLGWEAHALWSYHLETWIESSCSVRHFYCKMGGKEVLPRRIGTKGARPVRSTLVVRHWLLNVLSMRIIERRIALMVIHVAFFGVTCLLSAFGLLLSNAVDARARVDGIIYRPIRAFSAICERAGNLLETWIERQIVPNGIL